MTAWVLGHRTVTAHNAHELEVVVHSGRPVLVKRFRVGAAGWEREVWARKILDTYGVRLAPPLYWATRDAGRRAELAMELIHPDTSTLRSAPLAAIHRLGTELGRLHGRCQVRNTLASGSVARLWLLTKARQVAALHDWPWLLPAGPKLLLRGLDASRQYARLTLVHRDLTDGNILIQEGRPWVIDWEVSTIGHPDLDLARLRLSLTEVQIEALHESYRGGWAETGHWHAERLSHVNQAVFRLLFCIEMWDHLRATGQAEASYAAEVLSLARQSAEALRP